MKAGSITQEVSPYKYISKQDLKAEPYDADEDYCNIDIKEKMATKEYQTIETMILLGLFIFQFLNKRNIVRYVNTKISPEKQHPNYANNLKKLYQDGAITKYVYGTTTLYSLTPASYRYFEERKNRRTHSPIKDINNPLQSISASKILERASLAQWHISLLCRYNKKIEKNIFTSYATIDGIRIFIPSYIEFIDDRKNRKRVLSIPMAKSKSGYKNFAENIEAAAQIFNNANRKKHVTMLVVVCASTDEIRKVGELLRRSEKLSAVTCLYTLDINTSNFKGLKNLYQYGYTDGNGILEVFSLE